MNAPGAYRPLADYWGTPTALLGRMPEESVVLMDALVAKLHRPLFQALKAKAPRALLTLRAGEQAKSWRMLDPVMRKGVALSRNATVVCIGGGTLGDLGTVAAHLLKRGVRLIHWPTTLLAAVDSSVGGKGALHLGSARMRVKNAIGVFHYADECWLSPELFGSLSEVQRREGEVEAWKMAVCLDAPTYARWTEQPPGLDSLIRQARALKAAVCEQDPYEQTGLRKVLNFGHTFGHLIETLSGFRVPHGDAVALGVLCALDVGQAMGTTREEVAAEVEQRFTRGPNSRKRLAQVLRRASPKQIAALLASDKKIERVGELQMVLLNEPGRHQLATVPPSVWEGLLPSWQGKRRR